jgi:succinyl-diaminopimelate desuccinylase
MMQPFPRGKLMAARKKASRDPSPFGRASLWIDNARDEAITLQAELVRRNAVGPLSGGPGELEKADFLEAWMVAQGFAPVRRLTSMDNGIQRPNLVSVLPGRDRSRCLWLMSHMDVVPPGDVSSWRSEPFVLRVEGDKLVGRGVEDNHQGIVSSLLAVKALIVNGVQPECDVGLLFVSDEESASLHGIRWLLDHHRDLFGPNDSFVVPDAGNEDGSQIEVAEKSILWLRLKTVGKQVHASTPHLGRNAMTAGAHLIVRLADLYSRFDARDPLFDPPSSTFEPTRHEASVQNVNTIPGDDVFYLDCRILPSVSVEAVQLAVREIAAEVARHNRVVVNVDIVQREDAAPSTPPSCDLVQRVIRSVRKVYNVDARPRGIGGGTVAAYLRRLGWPVVVWARQDGTAHRPNEYVWIPNLLGDAKVFASLTIGEVAPETSVIDVDANGPHDTTGGANGSSATSGSGA